MKYLIVHAHHEAKSFNGAQTQYAVEKLSAAGHEVKVSDLYADGFDPVSDWRNFTTKADAEYLKQQNEERYASENDGLAPDILAEIEKVEWADAVIFQFPLWWFGMPGILKGWVDKVFVAGRVYGGGQWYENGAFKGKLAMVSMTTGGPENMYQKDSLNPAMETILTPIHHGVFWFNGFEVVEPFITWGPARMTQEDREARLEDYVDRLLNIEDHSHIHHLPSAEVGEDMREIAKRYEVSWSLKMTPESLSQDLLHKERTIIAQLMKQGIVIDQWMNTAHSRGGLTFRVANEEELGMKLIELPLYEYLELNIDEIERSTIQYS